MLIKFAKKKKKTFSDNFHNLFVFITEIMNFLTLKSGKCFDFIYVIMLY